MTEVIYIISKRILFAIFRWINVWIAYS